MLTSGVNDEMLNTSGVNDGEEDEFDEDQLEDDGDDEDNEWDDDSEDEDNQNQTKSNNQTQKKPIDWKQKFHSTVTSQNRKMAEMEKELASRKGNKNITDEDMEKIKEKYDEEDLAIIEKIIQKKTNAILDERKTNSLADREKNIFLKEYPEISDPEFRHVQSLQKEYGYSLKKAYSILFGNKEVKQENRKSSQSVSNSFRWNSQQQNNKGSNSEAKEMADMEAFM